MTIWQLEQRISKQLFVWSAFSIVLGTALLFLEPFWRGLGLQCVIWGVIDALIAYLGQRNLNKKKQRVPDAKERTSLGRILLLNAAADVVYVAVGVGLIVFMASDFGRGNGWGVVLQGGFLLSFDLLHDLYSLEQVKT